MIKLSAGLAERDGGTLSEFGKAGCWEAQPALLAGALRESSSLNAYSGTTSSRRLPDVKPPCSTWPETAVSGLFLCSQGGAVGHMWANASLHPTGCASLAEPVAALD
jgi:hypothetical protein